MRIISLIETPEAVLHAFEIAKVSPHIVGLAFGVEDFSAELGVQRTQEGTEIAFARSAIAIATAAAQILSYDTPYIDVRNAEGLA